MRSSLWKGLVCFVAGSVAAIGSGAQGRQLPSGYDVVYQIFPRSYRDGNGDRVGDFKGIEQGLPTIQKLGCTALLINPIVKSEMYHNYFSSDWYAPDPSFGSLDDFRRMVRAAHRRKMKIILDMEPQYVQEGHRWMTGASDNPLLLNGVGYLYGHTIPGYNGKMIEVAAVNLNNPVVRDEIIKVFLFWANQGVDGFRIDHMMDDLDWKHVETDLYRKLWTPLEDAVRKEHPEAFFVAEQADWGDGKAVLQSTPTDAVFGFRLSGAIKSFDKTKIETAMREADAAIPPDRTELTFLENHDMERYASWDTNPLKQRLAAALLMTMRGSPSIYYGQELGMKGKQGQWQSDGNDIPVRLAYRWGSSLEAPATALWYKDSGPWWNKSYSSDHDGVSLEEEENDPNSLFNWYRKLIHLRLAHPALRRGSEANYDSGNPQLVAFSRSAGTETLDVYANLGSSPVRISRKGTDLLSGNRSSSEGYINVPAWGVVVIGK